MIEKIFKITAVILVLGITPLIIGSILSALGVINVGTGLGLGLLMVSSIIVSIVFLSVCLTLLAITSLYKLIKKW
tara:strand:+ start:33 stop:257 length:225 start_codon:yes stop_codon:yes gene_type:complete